MNKTQTTTSQSSKKSKDLLSVLRNLQKCGISEKKQSLSMEDRHELACEEAFNFIVRNYEKKMRESAQRGYTKTYLYIWYYETDSKSRKYKFKGCRIMDIVTKNNLIERLSNHFAEINEEFTVGWHKFRDSDPAKYGIYVSWADKDDLSKDKSGDKSVDDDDEVEIEVSV
jgi:hypothetical protein